MTNDLSSAIVETQTAVAHANSGDFWPVTIMTIVFGALFALLFYIWNTTIKSNNDRHNGHEKRFDVIDNKMSGQDTVNLQNIQLFNELHTANKLQALKIDRAEKDIEKLQE